jgi:A/G-specific adenine glycosylase
LPSPEAIVPALLEWFARHARDLPWRRTRDPYGIWISEIMLQQTQVATVIPYWHRWMESLPTIESLDQADEPRVLKLWEGLGYYSRARNLMKAARWIMTEHQGQFPDRLEDLLELPGVGRYTAGAIASIAFNQPAPILDGNVIRVLTRLYALAGDPKGKELNARLWQLAEEWVGAAGQTRPTSAGSPLAAGPCSALNQSLMELGATVCLPRAPKCDICPVQTFCHALQLNRVEAFPQTADRPQAEEKQYAVLVIERQGRYWIRQRPAGVVNAGFWEFPNLELKGKDGRATAAQWLSVPSAELVELGRFRHSITRYRIQLEVFLARPGHQRPPADPTGRWAGRAELESLPLTAAHRRIVKRALDSADHDPGIQEGHRR